MDFLILFYFANLGIFCGCITMIISYILTKSMHIMQDSPTELTMHFHKKRASLCGGIGILIAYVVIVLGGIEIAHVRTDAFYEYAGLHFYLACCIVLCSGIIKDIYRKTIIWIMFGIQMCAFCIFYLLLYYLDIQHYHNLLFILPLCYAFLFITTNSINTIDGIHGNAVLYVVVVLLSLCVVSCWTQSNFVGFAASVLLGIMLVFLLFNYPFGKMFLGDSGAFLLGFCLGSLMLLCVLQYNVSLWYCLSLLAYPICALISSLVCVVLRVRKNKDSLLQNLWQPHTLHLHYLLLPHYNNATALVINSAYALFVIWATCFYNNRIMLIIGCGVFCVLYALSMIILCRKTRDLYYKT